MADRYWVGGAGTWDATTTTNWSATSGGAGGASAPTSADNVIFNTLSNAIAYAVTVGTNANALDITIAGPAVGNVTITSGATAVINCYGSWTNAATGVVFTTTTGATINFLATTTGKTITTNAVTLGGMQIIFNGVGGEWTLGSALTTTLGIVVTAGSFSTSGSNYALATNQISSNNSNVRSISLNASVVTISGATFLNFPTTATNLTFNAGTSTIIGSSNSGTLNGGGVTFYNVSFTGVTALTHTINGANTFNNLTFTSRTTDGVGAIVVSANQTISGTLTLGAANTAVRRLFVRSAALGTQRTLTVATIATLSDVDFRDIVAAGASGTWAGTRLGNCLNNSNITFAAGVNKYLRSVNGANSNWSGTVWSTSSSDTAVPTLNEFPLAQDTCIIDDSGATVNNGLRTGNTITIDANWNMGTLSFSGRTAAFNWTQGNFDPAMYGNVTLTTAMTMTTTTGSPSWTFCGQGAIQTLNSAGLVIRLNQLIVDSPGWGLTLAVNTEVDLSPIALPYNNGTFILTAGTLDFADKTLTAVTFSCGAGANTLVFGSTGTITSTATVAAVCFTGSTTTTVSGTPLVIANGNTAAARTITPGVVTEANSISFRITAGTGTLGITTGSVRDLDFTDGVNPTGYAGAFSNSTTSVYGNFKASTSGMTRVPGTGTIVFAATSGTKTVDTAGVTFDCPFTFNGVGGTFQLAADLTSGATRTCTLTNGTLDLASYTLTIGLFSSANSNTRVLAFGTGKMVLTGLDTTVYTTTTGTGLTMTGTRTIEVTGVGLLGDTRVISGAQTAAGGVAANAANFYIQAGADTISLGTANRVYGTLDFTGFTGSTLTNMQPSIYGDLVLSSGMTVTSGTNTWRFVATTAQTITINFQLLDFPVTFDGIGGVWELQDTLSVGPTLTIINGTLKLKPSVPNSVGAFATSGTNQKFLQSTTPGTQAALVQFSGTNSVSYLTIQDSAATGGAVFQSYISDSNVNSGNNTGWNFGNVIAGNVITETATGTDTVASIAAFFNSLQETATGTDAINGRPFWDVINNTQTANWSAISTT